MLTQAELKQAYMYSAITGVLYRLQTGKAVGTCKKNRYLACTVNKQNYYVHRLIWLYMTGEWPESDIDHIDGNPANNKWENLRLCSKSDNAENQKHATAANKSTGLLGAYGSGSKFVAKIKVQGVAKHLGAFDTPEEAHQAYLTTKRELHSFNTL